MSEDPYKVLCLSPKASDDEIRKAYRKLAKDLHPDLNPGDKQAEEKFKQVSAAYHIVGDPERRKRFDAGEIDASGAERPQHPYYREYADSDGGARYASSAGFEDFGDMSDVFADLFRQQAGARTGGGTIRMRGQDIGYRLAVDFLEAANGATKRIEMPGGQSLDVKIPAGSREGTVLRLKGKGGPGHGGGPAGDALIEIHVNPHRFFRRSGDDILVDLPITLDEAVLGAKVEVPTLTGKVSMKVPKASSSGDVLRLKGKGLKRGSGAAGDQLVTLSITLPEEVDPDLESFMKEWREKHAHDPRSHLRRAG
jgi:DnaJ-class molecular chaperone